MFCDRKLKLLQRKSSKLPRPLSPRESERSEDGEQKFNNFLKSLHVKESVEERDGDDTLDVKGRHRTHVLNGGTEMIQHTAPTVWPERLPRPQSDGIVCSVLKTKWPVNAAWIAISAVSKSRISPTRMMSGS